MPKKESKPVKSKIDSEALNQAVKIMEKGDLCELLYEDGSIKIQLKKAGSVSFTQNPVQPLYQAQMPAVAAPAALPQSAAPAAAAKPQENPNEVSVKSPMVGTFYRAPSPEAPPFINIGDNVEPGKTLCIIEAMKIMNEIKCEVKGKVKEILVENAQAVEFNQPIIIIEKI
ncbi:MAG TPA: acetyl-CoA carboxylase biotin carboxyl carrier protein [Candidatus Goldiibacteriota bacterium]|nr:acetyl-CoA carboxylase biotin carboxyl carrier protein [Candidatus Goldiibacteriota bacterium]